jgi:hypothetical protein
VNKIWLLFNVETGEYRTFEDEATLNKFTANKYGHVEGQITPLPKEVRVMELPVFSLENVHYAYAH